MIDDELIVDDLLNEVYESQLKIFTRILNCMIINYNL